jgi:4-hydroxy-tetrahydrodipicolinate synthase
MQGEESGLNAEAMRHGLFPSVPVPHRSDGTIDREAQSRYIAWMGEQPIGGVAIWTPHGRGLKLDERARENVARAWRSGLAGKPIIAAVGPTTTERRPDRVIASARALAFAAVEEGMNALLAMPPTLFRGLAEGEMLILEYHSAIAEAGLPLILLSLTEGAGGINYNPQTLAQLLARPEVLGINIATLNNILLYQQIVALTRSLAPSKLIITGEDRFLGYSLMSGADAALTALSSVCTTLQSRFTTAFWQGDATQFLALNGAVDELARHTFLSPLDAAPGRSLTCLAHLGIIPADAAFDPFGPRISAKESDQIRQCLERVRAMSQNLLSDQGQSSRLA